MTVTYNTDSLMNNLRDILILVLLNIAAVHAFLFLTSSGLCRLYFNTFLAMINK